MANCPGHPRGYGRCGLAHLLFATCLHRSQIVLLYVAFSKTNVLREVNRDSGVLRHHPLAAAGAYGSQESSEALQYVQIHMEI